jgi:hypothetical protein
MRLRLVLIKWPTPCLLATISQIRKRDLDLVLTTQRQSRETLDFGLEQLLELLIDLRICPALEHMTLNRERMLQLMGKQYLDLAQENDLLSLISMLHLAQAPMIQI